MENTIYGYARVSTKKQADDGNSLEDQEKKLRDAGATVIIKEKYTGSVTKRPELDKLLQEIKPGDTLIVTTLDRIARSTSHGIELIDCLTEKNITVYILNLGTLNETPIGNLVRNVLLSFAEFEREMIVERTQAGRAIARQDPNYKEGRPKKYTPKQLDHAMELLSTMSYKQVEEVTGISKSTLIREKKRRTALH